MSEHTDKLLTITKDVEVEIETEETDFIKNFNRISGDQLSVVESDEQIGLDFITKIVNSYESQDNIDIAKILIEIGYNKETVSQLMSGNRTISDFEFQGRLYDYYIARKTW